MAHIGIWRTIMTSASRIRSLGRGAIYALLLGLIAFNMHRAADREQPAEPAAMMSLAQ